MGWLGTWENRRKITISNTNVDAVLSNFPILIKISASSGTSYADLTDIFTELTADANRKKIAITTSDGTTECYVEIERWDHANSAAWLWVKVPSVASGSATELFIYYDVAHADNTTYVGDTTDAAAQSVWDSNFKGVWHLAQDPNGDPANAIKDSTSNAHHMSPNGSMTSADLVDGKIGKAIDFDGGSDYLEEPDHADFDIIDYLTLHATFNMDHTRIDNVLGMLLSKSDAASSGGGYDIWTDDRSGQLTNAVKVNIYNGPSNVLGKYLENVAEGWHDVCATYDKDLTGTARLLLYLDGVSVGTYTTSGDYSAILANNLPVRVARDSGSNDFYGNSVIDECSIAHTARSAAWIKATYYSNWDGLVAFSAAETTPGLASDNVECSTEVTSPSLSFVPGTLDDVSCGTQVTAPALDLVTKDINASDVSCLTQVTSPSLDKIKNIDASNVESSSEITTVSTAFPCDIDATLPMMTADFLGGGGGLIDAALPVMSADILGGGTIIAATLPVMSAAIEGKVGIVGEIEATLPTMTASITGTTNVLAEIDATLPAMTALVVGVVGDSAALAATLPMITAALDGYHDITGDIDTDLPMMSAYITGAVERFEICTPLRYEEPEL